MNVTFTAGPVSCDGKKGKKLASTWRASNLKKSRIFPCSKTMHVGCVQQGSPNGGFLKDDRVSCSDECQKACQVGTQNGKKILKHVDRASFPMCTFTVSVSELPWTFSMSVISARKWRMRMFFQERPGCGWWSFRAGTTSGSNCWLKWADEVTSVYTSGSYVNYVFGPRSCVGERYHVPVNVFFVPFSNDSKIMNAVLGCFVTGKGYSAHGCLAEVRYVF